MMASTSSKNLNLQSVHNNRGPGFGLGRGHLNLKLQQKINSNSNASMSSSRYYPQSPVKKQLTSQLPMQVPSDLQHRSFQNLVGNDDL